MASAWASGPDRGLAPIQKEDGPEDPSATFHPELSSDQRLREKAKSSNYGSIVPKVEKVVLEANDLRPWEEQPTFAPEMPECSVRARVKSSSYGSVLPKKEEREAPSPSFKPELVTENSKVSQEWKAKARSSSYGKEIAQVNRPKSAPRPTFTPELPKSTARDKYKESVVSSKYGEASPARVERPKTAPTSRDLKLDTPRNGKSASPEHKVKDPLEERASPGGFVLDCVRMGEAINEAAKYPGVRIPEGLNLQKPLVTTEYSRKLKEAARSSSYGEASPARGEKPPEKKPEPRFAYGGKSVLHESPEPIAKRSPLNEKVRSQGYGTASPVKVERPPPKEPERLWTPTLSVAKVELSDVPRSKLNDKVASHAYGIASPAKGERSSTPLEPVWVPSSKRGGIPEPEPHRRASSQYEHVRSHYGADYNPSANASTLPGDQPEDGAY